MEELPRSQAQPCPDSQGLFEACRDLSWLPLSVKASGRELGSASGPGPCVPAASAPSAQQPLKVGGRPDATFPVHRSHPEQCVLHRGSILSTEVSDPPSADTGLGFHQRLPEASPWETYNAIFPYVTETGEWEPTTGSTKIDLY